MFLPKACILIIKYVHSVSLNLSQVRPCVEADQYLCSTFLIPKTLQASLTTETSQVAAVNGLSPSANCSLVLAKRRKVVVHHKVVSGKYMPSFSQIY